MRFSAFGGRAGIYARVTAQRLRGFSLGENGSSIYEMASTLTHYFSCNSNQHIMQIRKSMQFTRITMDPERMGGVPCIRSLRIPVATIVDMVAEDMGRADILQAYP